VSIEQALSWLPSDTETLIVANRPFPLSKRDEAKKNARPDVETSFQAMPLTPPGFKNPLLLDHFNGRRVALGLEGARHFRRPRSLGLMPFEGCTIVVFADDQSESADAFFKASSSVALRIEEVEEQRVAVFQERTPDNDLWTTFVSFSKPNLLLVATNLDYLREVLSRMRGKIGPRALPETLPEWKYVNAGAKYWGLRHYDRAQADLDPSSPFGGPKAANFPDEQAIGLVFSFEPHTRRRPTITYLSGDPQIAKGLKKGALSMGYYGAKFGVEYRELDAQAIQASYNLGDAESVGMFLFILMALLGHGVYL
jgi:hypothetical protein